MSHSYQNLKVVGRRVWMTAVAASALSMSAVMTHAGEDLLRSNCLGCHIPTSAADEPLQLSRISAQRKTPEGWSMTIARMQVVHGLVINADDRDALVKHLADTQGLTPEEASPYRYILEQRLNHQEEKQPELAEMCARCHSEARAGLQRRDEAEWEKLVHFHLGQWPSVEYSAMGRDRDWFGIALNKVVPHLGETFGLQSSVWQQWQQQPQRNLSGRWRVVGNSAADGDFHGVMTVDGEADDYRVQLSGQFASGKSVTANGNALIYSGFEWRGSLSSKDGSFRQVFAFDAERNALIGRMFNAHQETMGLDIQAYVDDGSQLLSVSPSYVKAGKTAEISLRGTQLSGDVEFPKGIEVKRVLSRSGDEIRVLVSADKNLSPQKYSVSVGATELKNSLAVYDTVAKLNVLPGYAVARVGGQGSQAKKPASFRAQAISAGRDGELNTDDDFVIGDMSASWRVEPFDQKAIDDRDVEFAGLMNQKTGVFTPGEAGPNPARKYGTNNAGRLKVIATISDESTSLQGESELIVTVQRWNNPPIR